MKIQFYNREREYEMQHIPYFFKVFFLAKPKERRVRNHNVKIPFKNLKISSSRFVVLLCYLIHISQAISFKHL